MKTQVESVSDVKKIIHFEIPWDDVDKRIRNTVRQISRSAKIPGFRPGKAPETLIRTRYAQHIKDEVINHIVPEAYQEVLKDNQFDIVSEPSLHDVMYSEGSPFLFKVTIETRPTIEVKNYKGIELTGDVIDVKDDEVEAVLKEYQERSAELIPQEAPAEKGHYLNAQVKASLQQDGKSQPLFDNRTLIEIGAERNHPAFNENLIGKKAGDKVDFEIQYPQDEEEKAIAGKTVYYHVLIENVNQKRISALDDEFAKDLGDYESLAQLKDQIRKDLEKVKTREQRNRWKEDILKRVIEENPFEVPESLVQRETESLLHNYAHALKQRGLSADNPKIDWKDLQGKFEKQADQTVRSSIMIEAIARAENVQVTDEDIERTIAEIADQQRRPPEAVKAEIAKGDRMDSLKRRVLFSKTMDFLLDNAKTEIKSS